jgi:hypothetical protein
MSMAERSNAMRRSMLRAMLGLVAITLGLMSLLANAALLGGTKPGGGSYTALDAPGATSTSAVSVSGNNVVGFCIDAAGVGHGFLYVAH